MTTGRINQVDIVPPEEAGTTHRTTSANKKFGSIALTLPRAGHHCHTDPEEEQPRHIAQQVPTRSLIASHLHLPQWFEKQFRATARSAGSTHRTTRANQQLEASHLLSHRRDPKESSLDTSHRQKQLEASHLLSHRRDLHDSSLDTSHHQRPPEA